MNLSVASIAGVRVVEDDRVTQWGDACADAVELEVAALSDGWGDGEPRTFRSGAGPVQALERAVDLLNNGEDYVRIRCVDPLRTGYDREERARLMRIYGDVSIPEGYSRFAEYFCAEHGVAREEFAEVARALEANYRDTASARGVPVAPPGTHDAMVTDWFRRVDCANPKIDFECDVLLASPRLGLPGPQVLGVASSNVSDGPEHIDEIARFDHFVSALSGALEQAGVSLDDLWNAGALEVYTCFPIVPLAFLMKSGLAGTADEALRRIRARPLTVSGGMTLAYGPWNGPALRGLALVAKAIVDGAPLGLVHGNGGLGAYQSVAVLGVS